MKLHAAAGGRRPADDALDGLVRSGGGHRVIVAAAVSQRAVDVAVVGVAAFAEGEAVVMVELVLGLVLVELLLLLAPKGGAPAQALGAGAAVGDVLVAGVAGVGEVVEGVEDVGKDLGGDVAGPEEVEVLVVGDFGGDGGGGQLAEHGADVDEGVAAAVDEHDGGGDVAGRVFRDLGEARGVAETEGRVVVVHLEGLGADDLEPVHDGLCGGEGVEVGVGGEFLGDGDVGGAPVEEEADAHVDNLDVEGRVDDGLPQRGGAEDTAAAKEEEQHLRRGLDQGVGDAVGQARGRHGRREGDEDVDLLVELRVDRQRGEGLGRALREANVRERRLARVAQDVLDTIRNVVEGELVDGEVPELQGRRGRVDRLLGVLVAPVVAQLANMSVLQFPYMLLG